jgi:branched-chain amino acid transport system substrate-binding protein
MNAVKTFLFVFLVGVLLTGCNKKTETINIGFVAGLSGKYSAFGTSVRDGFLLAFDEIDFKINGQSVNIVEKDDKQNKEEAKRAIEYFIANGIKLVVGNATSSMTAVSFPMINKQEGMLLFSPTASSMDFSAQDDNFIRIQVDASKRRYQVLLKYLKDKHYKNLFFIYDSKNISHVKGYEKILQKEFIKQGGNPYVAKFDLNNDYKELLKKLHATEHDLIMIVGNSIDSSKVIQYMRINNIDSPVLASNWARTSDFITNGGKHVEGVIFTNHYDDNSQKESFVKFVESFKRKYKKEPSVFHAHGYETAQILIENLKKSTDISKLKKSILETKVYQGVQEEIVFDQYGDVSRRYFMLCVKDGKYTKLQ